MKKLAAELELTEEARRIAELNKSRAKDAEKLQVEDGDTVKDFLMKHQSTTELPEEVPDEVMTRSPVKLKGVELPKFGGDGKTAYEPWKAAFMTMVDSQNIPVGEKMLRLQGSLTGKALTLVKDLGYSSAAYERAKSKLEKRCGGERRLQIKHLTTLRNWIKVRSCNLQDLKEFQALLERILVSLDDSAPLREQSLNFSAKEKLSEYDIQSYKYWLMDHAREDTFRSLVDWVELRIQIMEEAREETEGLVRGRRSDRAKLVTASLSEDSARSLQPGEVSLKHVPKRKELISKSGRCFRCLAAGHHSRDCRYSN